MLRLFLIPFRALGHRPFALLWSGQTISRLGDSLYQLALAWWVLEKTQSGTMMALVMVLSFAPLLVLGLLGGALVDRLPRLRVMLYSDLLRGVIVTLVAVLAYGDKLEVWHVCIASLIFGIVDAFFQPAYIAAIPEMLTKEALPSANSLTNLSTQVSGMFGPLLAALIIVWGGTSGAFLLDGLSFFISAAFLLPMANRPAIPRPPAQLANIKQETIEGLKLVIGIPWLWITILLAALGNITRGGPILVTLPFLIQQNLAGDVNTLSIYRAMAFAGSVVGAIALGYMRNINKRGPLAYIAMIVAGVMTLLIGLPITIYGVMAAGLVIGVCTAMFNLIWTNTLQEMIPNDKLGRVGSIDYLGSLVFIPIGLAITGWLTDLVGPSQVFVIGGILTILIWVLGLLHPVVRRLD